MCGGNRYTLKPSYSTQLLSSSQIKLSKSHIASWIQTIAQCTLRSQRLLPPLSQTLLQVYSFSGNKMKIEYVGKQEEFQSFTYFFYSLVHIQYIHVVAVCPVFCSLLQVVGQGLCPNCSNLPRVFVRCFQTSDMVSQLGHLLRLTVGGCRLPHRQRVQECLTSFSLYLRGQRLHSINEELTYSSQGLFIEVFKVKPHCFISNKISFLLWDAFGSMQ